MCSSDERPPASIQEISDYVSYAYGMRNGMRLTGSLARIGFLAIAAKDLQDAVRKKSEIHKIGIALARVLARVFCVADTYHDLPLAEQFAGKYLGGACSYCQHIPCTCTDEWRPASMANRVDDQADWDLSTICQVLNRMYGKANQQKGIDNAIGRLFSEIGELIAETMNSLTSTLKNSELEKKIALELADVLAWVIAIANFFEIDLLAAFQKRYWPHCQYCGQIPCECGPFNVQTVDWSMVTEPF